MRLAGISILAGLLIGVLSAGAGEATFRDAEIGSQAARIGATLLLGAPAFGLGTALLAAALGFLLGRSARRRAPPARKRAIESQLPQLDGGRQHQLIAIYRLRPGTIDQVARRAEVELAGSFRKRPGFVAYEFVKTGQTEAVSVSTWSSREHAEAAVDTAVAWATVKVARAIVSMENHVGAVVVSDRATASVAGLSRG